MSFSILSSSVSESAVYSYTSFSSSSDNFIFLVHGFLFIDFPYSILKSLSIFSLEVSLITSSVIKFTILHSEI